ncbi:hypothetical protein B484DRAFT_396584 [Ochromonadaceae sp. CCMP2298]|nr:hypothetical protein B484DRAFT_396584 [Ochromonadaceae sp. CCMP2298]
MRASSAADRAIALRHVSATILMYLLPHDIFQLAVTSKPMRDLAIAWAGRMYVEQDNYQEAFQYSDIDLPVLRPPLDPQFTSSYSANILLFCAKYARFKRARDSVQFKLKEHRRICTTLTNFAAILAGCCSICRRRWTGSLSEDLGLHACPTCIRSKVKNVFYYSNEEKAAITASHIPTMTYEGCSSGAYSRGAYEYQTVWDKKHPIMPPQWVVEERLAEGFQEARIIRRADVQKRAAEEVAMQRGLAEMRAAEEPQRRAIAAQLHIQEVQLAAEKKAKQDAALPGRLQKLRAHKQLGENLDIVDELVALFARPRPSSISLPKGAFGNFFTPVLTANRSLIKVVSAVQGLRAVLNHYGVGVSSDPEAGRSCNEAAGAGVAGTGGTGTDAVPNSLRELLVRCAGLELVSVQAVREQDKLREEERLRVLEEQRLRRLEMQILQRMQLLRQEQARLEQQKRQQHREQTRQQQSQSGGQVKYGGTFICGCGKTIAKACTLKTCGTCCNDTNCIRHRGKRG